jgi:nicotinate-nucleotide--dimethylbenzimidazole phosphoribosyltransferase
MNPPSSAAMAAAAERQAQLTKPPGSLGRLEDIAVRVAGITGQAVPVLGPLRVVVAAADHGVARRGVSAYPMEVTPAMVANFAAGGAAINQLADDVVVVDCGVAAECPASYRAGERRVSGDITVEPAMSGAERDDLIDAGRAAADRAADDGVGILVGGEMGIGNTTPASAIAAALTGLPAEKVVGPGTGLLDLTPKVAAVEAALRRCGPPEAPLDVLAELGGLEIAFLTGLAIGAGDAGIVYILDGVIATAAAALAIAIEPILVERVFAGSRSPEPGSSALLEHLGLEPILDLRMRLGEGTGAALAARVVRAACEAHSGMATFSEAGVPDA